MTHGSLFSGIGGFDLAAEWMGWQNVFHCEWNTFGQKVLKYYWPEAISYNDITQTDFTIHRGRIDILTGGFPCQPYSMAGKRLGKEDDRHLWPEMLRAIREIQPRWVVGENVFGLVNWSDGLVFHEVQADLETEGYEVQPFILPAVSVNAPHRRDRVWFVAKNTCLNGCLFGESIEEGAEVREQRDIGAGDTERICGEEMAGITSDTDTKECNRWGSISEREWETSEQGGDGIFGTTTRLGKIRDAADTDNKGLERNASQRIQAHERGRDRIQNDVTSWMGIRTDWQTFPTESPICDGNDGIPDRLDGITFSKWRQESIKAGGNAVVPQVVLQIFRTIEEYEKTHAQ